MTGPSAAPLRNFFATLSPSAGVSAAGFEPFRTDHRVRASGWAAFKVSLAAARGGPGRHGASEPPPWAAVGCNNLPVGIARAPPGRLGATPWAAPERERR